MEDWQDGQMKNWLYLHKLKAGTEGNAGVTEIERHIVHCHGKIENNNLFQKRIICEMI